MKACAAHHNLPSPTSSGNLFLPVPDTEFRDFLEQIDELVRFAPGILAAIERDLDKHGKKKKTIRLADKRFVEGLTGELPGLPADEYFVSDFELCLGVGRPRMPAYLAYVFLMIRGELGSVTRREDVTFIRESISLYSFLQQRGYQMPGATTVLENINAVSNETRELIFDSQLRFIRVKGLDDFKELIIDSTQVEANSAWPTDAKILTGLLSRAHRLGQKLELFDLPGFRVWWMNQWLRKMRRLTLMINLAAGKPRSKRKIKKHYRRLLEFGRKAVAHLDKELQGVEDTYQPYDFLFPSRREMLRAVMKQISEDIGDAYRVIDYTGERIFEGKTGSSRDKVLSLADKTAAYIKKGGREAVIGYKPQIARSGQGFITGLMVKEGNPADKGELVPLFNDVVNRTGVAPEVVSADDGYASEKGRNNVLGRGVEVMSLSGVWGKKLIGEENWESEIYREARRSRPAIESLIFVLKHCFEFGRLGRRGLEAVRAELLEKALAFNSYRIIYLREKKRQKLKWAA